MKVEVQYIVTMKDGVKQLGRKCFVGKNGLQELTFGNIYTTFDTACNDICEVELNQLEKMSKESGCFIITNIYR